MLRDQDSKNRDPNNRDPKLGPTNLKKVFQNMQTRSLKNETVEKRISLRNIYIFFFNDFHLDSFSSHVRKMINIKK